MTQKKSKNKNKEGKSLQKLIKKSHVIRKNIDTIMSAFKRIEKHIGDMQKNVSERRVRQQSMSNRLEELMKNVQELDEKLKPKSN
jgi:chromosome segregation ATPase